MTEQEFLDVVREKCHTYFLDPKRNQYSRSPQAKYNVRRDKSKTELDDVVYIKWHTGGVAGGSCWDDGSEDHHYHVDGEPEPEFNDLDIILEAVAPGISFLQYKGIVRDIVKYSSYEEHEYYGNSSNYGVKEFKLRYLWQKLQEFLK